MACHLAGVTTAVATCGTAFGVDHIKVLRRVMGDDPRRARSSSPSTRMPPARRPRCARSPRSSASPPRPTSPSRPTGSTPATCGCSRGDDAVRGAHRTRRSRCSSSSSVSASRATTSRPSRAGSVRSRAAAPIVADIRDPLAAARVHPRARPPPRRGPRRGAGREVERAARGDAQRRRPATAADATAAEGAEDGTGGRASTLASPPATPTDVALERDALMAILQYGHRLDRPRWSQRAVAHRSGNPALAAVRDAIAAALDMLGSPDGRRSHRHRARAVPLARRPSCSRADSRRAEEDWRCASARSRAALIDRGARPREATSCSARSSGSPADSEEGRALRMRLRELDGRAAQALAEG